MSLIEFLDPVVNRFTRQTLPTLNRKHFCMNFVCIESLRPQKTHNRTLLVASTLKHRRHLTTKSSLWTCACASAT
jgi:hypothetical protein